MSDPVSKIAKLLYTSLMEPRTQEEDEAGEALFFDLMKFLSEREGLSNLSVILAFSAELHSIADMWEKEIAKCLQVNDNKTASIPPYYQ